MLLPDYFADIELQVKRQVKSVAVSDPRLIARGNPLSIISVIADAAATDNSQCSNTLSKLVSEGKVIREKNGLVSYYSVSPNYEPIPETLPYVPTVSTDEMIRQEKVVADLEQRGLWRRAITELARLADMQCTSIGVAIVAQRRNHCRNKLRLKSC